MKITSPAFRHGADIPARHTCDGDDHSPPLEWTGVPKDAKALVLVVDDHEQMDPAVPGVPPPPPAPQRVHWLLYDIPVSTTGAPAGVVPKGARVGANEWQEPAWKGPCPESGRHRYLFTLYAVDTVLGKRGALTKAELMEAIDGHVVGEAALDGRYERSGGKNTYM